MKIFRVQNNGLMRKNRWYWNFDDTENHDDSACIWNTIPRFRSFLWNSSLSCHLGWKLQLWITVMVMGQ